MEKVAKNIPLIKEGELWSPIQPYKEKSVMEVIGKPLTLEPRSNIAAEWEEATNILRIYDNPRFETARYLIVSGRKIAEHIAVSSQIPVSTNVYPHTWMLNRLRKQIEETDSSVLFSHNHPSGIVLPSQNDIEVTKYLAQYFIDGRGKSRFLGHIITGTGGASFTDSDGKVWSGLHDGGIVPLEKFPHVPSNMDLLNVQGDLGLAKLQIYVEEICKKSDIDTDKNIFACYSDAAGFITGVKSIPLSLFWKNQNAITEDINISSKSAGAASVYLVICKNDRELFAQIENYAQNAKKIAGAIMSPNIRLDKRFCSERIFHERDTVPLKIEDSREIKRLMAMQRQSSLEYECER